MSMFVCVCEYQCPQRSEEDTGFPGAGPYMDAGSPAQALWRAGPLLTAELSLQPKRASLKWYGKQAHKEPFGEGFSPLRDLRLKSDLTAATGSTQMLSVYRSFSLSHVCSFLVKYLVICCAPSFNQSDATKAKFWWFLFSRWDGSVLTFVWWVFMAVRSGWNKGT